MKLIKPILKIPSIYLRNKNKNSLPIIGALHEKQLKDSLAAHGKGVGLAGPQIGINRRVCIISLVDTRSGALIGLHNPHFVPVGDKKISIYEGCLSIPNRRVEVPRYNNIIVHYHNKWGKSMPLLELSGYEAIIVQHEIDHLNGILITDYNPGVSEEEYEKIVNNLEDTD